MILSCDVSRSADLSYSLWSVMSNGLFVVSLLFSLAFPKLRLCDIRLFIELVEEVPCILGIEATEFRELMWSTADCPTESSLIVVELVGGENGA
jgi:hypothetical protein